MKKKVTKITREVTYDDKDRIVKDVEITEKYEEEISSEKKDIKINVEYPKIKEGSITTTKYPVKSIVTNDGNGWSKVTGDNDDMIATFDRISKALDKIITSNKPC